jgi:hypothetical protein
VPWHKKDFSDLVPGTNIEGLGYSNILNVPNSNEKVLKEKDFKTKIPFDEILCPSICPSCVDFY